MNPDLAYKRLLSSLFMFGERVTTRNSRVRRITGQSFVFTRTPLVSLRKVAWKNALREWEWFMSGSPKIRDLHQAVHHWWSPFADEDGYLRFNYGEQFRSFVGDNCTLDQIKYLVDGIRDHPYSRRNVITTWNTADMASGHCNPTNCHGTIIQCFVSPPEKEGDAKLLHMFMYQRSADVICGLPHNWIQYWAFLMWLAHRAGCVPCSFKWMGGDIHLYDIHENLARDMLTTEATKDGPELVYKPSGDDFKADDFSLSGEYKPILKESAPMVV